MGRASRAAALTLVAGAFVPASASAQQGDGIAIAPSRVEAEVRVGGRTPAIAVTNNTSRPVEVRVQPFPATQAASGMPAYETDRASRRRGNDLLRVSSRRFVLGPGATRRVTATVRACPQTGLGTYAVMEFTVGEVSGSSRGAARVTGQLQLTTPMLLSYPPEPCMDAELTALRAEQAGRERIDFVATVRNAGNLHGRPVTRLDIRRDEATVASFDLPAENILPGASRELRASFDGRLPAGRYDLVVETSLGSRSATLRRTLRLTAVNTVPTPKLALRGMEAAATAPGSAPEITGAVANPGTGRATGEVRFELRRAGSAEVVDVSTVEVEALAPGASMPVDTILGRVERGAWEVAVTALLNGRESDRRELTLTVREPAGAVDRSRDWLAVNAERVVLGLALLVAAVAAALALVARRRRRPLATAATPAAPLEDLAAIRSALARLESDARLSRLGPSSHDPEPARGVWHADADAGPEPSGGDRGVASPGSRDGDEPTRQPHG